ncbi:hypothetical protein B0H66DRAFT_567958 [Apodospora peruviana]|uniref:Uncharacterized protein n=1 Tax=Apodospora peruviana TaxID=516989 RepID=A0AAE0HWH0_9PEZI|nr:hypothetical protein B0H66DRAFT_567958 [Apodospora peruviana]
MTRGVLCMLYFFCPNISRVSTSVTQPHLPLYLAHHTNETPYQREPKYLVSLGQYSPSYIRVKTPNNSNLDHGQITHRGLEASIQGCPTSLEKLKIPSCRATRQTEDG